jgi:hypothetical protein
VFQDRADKCRGHDGDHGDTEKGGQDIEHYATIARAFIAGIETYRRFEMVGISLNPLGDAKNPLFVACSSSDTNMM